VAPSRFPRNSLPAPSHAHGAALGRPALRIECDTTQALALGEPGLAAAAGPHVCTASANEVLIDVLARWGVTTYAGVNGGGLIHFTRHLGWADHLGAFATGRSTMLTATEYLAGFVPLGYHVATGGVAAAVCTTGAAIKLALCGLSDAKLHNIPAVYIVALNGSSSDGLCPLQDVSPDGMNVVAQLEAELGEGCVVLDGHVDLAEKLATARRVLDRSQPVVFAIRPDALRRSASVIAPERADRARPTDADIDRFVWEFPAHIRNRRVVLYVCEEAARVPGIQDQVTELARLLRAPTVWSMNGAAAVASDNAFAFGGIGFGGHDRARDLWASLTEVDTVVALGFDPGEYPLNCQTLPTSMWHFTALARPYGHRGGGFGHRVSGSYHRLEGDIGETLKAIVPRLRTMSWERPPPVELPEELNSRALPRSVRTDCVDLAAFFRKVHALWRPGSVGFDDVCMAYKDRAYVTGRPSANIRFFSAYNGSAMGGAVGMAAGAKLAAPHHPTFVFSGDGCWRLFGGGLADLAGLELCVFVLNNGTFALVDSGLRITLPELHPRSRHTKLRPVDFVGAARAQGWDALRVDPDLENLVEVMDACYARRGRSLLVEVPVDPDEMLGPNPRAHRL
jgi:acetolactate synthase I/II/III large subunit